MTTRDWTQIPEAKDGPDFDNLVAVLEGNAPSRPTLYELFLND